MKFDDFIKIGIEILNNDSETHLSHFNKLSDSLFSLFINRIKDDNLKSKNERQYHLNLITQKFLVHTFSLKKLIDGIYLESKSQNLIIKISDPFSIHTLVRTLLETYLVQNYLSNEDKSDNVLDFRFKIWMRYGLKQRNIQPNDDESNRVNNQDIKSINFLEKSIKENPIFINFTDEKKITFLKTINKEWKLDFVNKKFLTLSWKDLLKKSGVNEAIYNQIYNFLSWHAHSQSISILQLKSIWENKEDKETVIISVKKINMFLSFIISDIVKSDEEFKIAYRKLEPDYRNLINFYNYSYRGEKYSIEKLVN
jgi:hypothetical protein